MKELIYSGLKILILFIVIIVIINDVGVLIMTQISASDYAQVVADSAVSSYKTSHSPATSEITAQEVADQRGMKLIYFQMDKNKVTVTVKLPPKRTFFIHRIKSLESYLSAQVTTTADMESPID
jgi:hypothetical protein